ncbi:MAG: lipid IV(A) 3-deoxy-D-manno-octulosonic acid transferase [Betaproteobacteria bacterium]|nr:lipid IV(A) 3-deoxy-D-manno-octulosonic acid transferase [Betaproteobacteria bacterium]
MKRETWLRAAYSGLFWLLLPFILLRLFWRGRREPRYRQHIGERFGFYRRPRQPKTLWVHAVSVGEVRAAEPLVKALLLAYPNESILLTCMTPTGRATATSLFDARVIIAYLPYDLPGAIKRLFVHFRPRVLLVMETEIWFNLLRVCRSHGVPAMLVNARLSARSQQGYARFAAVRALAREALASFTVVAAQSGADAERLASLGARSPVVTGNIKFDMAPAPALIELGRHWRETLLNQQPGRRVLLAASTREGEEVPLLAAYQTVFADSLDRVLLVIVPRHPPRFDEVYALIQQSGLSVARRSQSAVAQVGCQVWLGDSMGEMAAYYTFCDVALIGGSFAPLGGQNLIEACAVGAPVIVGPHTFNFSEAVRLAQQSGALSQVAGIETAMQAARRLLENEGERQRMATAAIDFAKAHQGATRKTMALIANLRDGE